MPSLGPSKYRVARGLYVSWPGAETLWEPPVGLCLLLRPPAPVCLLLCRVKPPLRLMEHRDTWGRGEPFGSQWLRAEIWEALRVEGGVKSQGSKGKEGDEREASTWSVA